MINTSNERCFKLKKPCAECPFHRGIEPGELGGSPTETYVGQIFGPFWIPCHMDVDYSDPNWRTDTSKAQCAGAATIRANIGIDKIMPSALHKLPPDREQVFSGPVEFVAHHQQISEEEAKKQILETGIAELCKRQMEHSRTKFYSLDMQEL